MDGILCDRAIQAAIDKGDIEIDPFDPAQLNITSYDLTLGSEVRVYSDMVRGAPSSYVTDVPSQKEAARAGERLTINWGHFSLDSKVEPDTEAWEFDDKGFLLRPGIGYLMHTRERVCSNVYNPILDGKSSIGRLFIQVHATAGYGDPGFNGQYTLEVIVQHPVRVYAGMRICQVRFHTISGTPSKLYNQVGHYNQESAKGAVASQAWKQFQGK